jgi:two-component system response regulator MprA
MRVLLVDDDRELAEYVRRGLEEEGYDVTVRFDGSAGLDTAERTAFDILVLDVMMPFLDGFEVTRRFRRLDVRTPILLLTARDAPEDVVRGLDAGADDYLTKPFPFAVLLARLRARTRSAEAGDAATLRYADLVLDPGTREVRRGAQPIRLTRTEFSILECLMRSPGRVVTRDRLIDQVWGDRDVSHNNLEVFVRHLRLKLDVGGGPPLVKTERGLGYSLKDH